MDDAYTERCKSLVFYLPYDAVADIYRVLEKMSVAYDQFFVYFLIITGPILFAFNIFVMLVLTRKEMRSPYNAIFVAMALDHSLSIMNISLWLARVLITRSDCNYWSYTLFWKRLDILLVVLDDVFRVHVSWLAVIITAVRLKSLGKNGTEPPIRFILLVCGISFALVAICFVPQFLSYEIIWIEKNTTCVNELPRQVIVPRIEEIELLFKQDCLLLRMQFFIDGLFNILPCLSLTVIMTLLLLRISKIRKGCKTLTASSSLSCDSIRVSRMLIAIIIITLITAVPQAVLSILVSLLSDRFRSSVANRLDSFIVTLSIIANVCNFCVHLLMSRRFREAAKKSICCFCTAVMKKKNVIASS